jgi:hypothetical protein
MDESWIQLMASDSLSLRQEPQSAVSASKESGRGGREPDTPEHSEIWLSGSLQLTTTSETDRRIASELFSVWGNSTAENIRSWPNGECGNAIFAGFFEAKLASAGLNSGSSLLQLGAFDYQVYRQPLPETCAGCNCYRGISRPH